MGGGTEVPEAVVVPMESPRMLPAHLRDELADAIAAAEEIRQQAELGARSIIQHAKNRVSRLAGLTASDSIEMPSGLITTKAAP